MSKIDPEAEEKYQQVLAKAKLEDSLPGMSRIAGETILPSLHFAIQMIKPFLHELCVSGYAVSTVLKHASHLMVHLDQRCRMFSFDEETNESFQATKKALFALVTEDEGPELYRPDRYSPEVKQGSFEYTCALFYRYWHHIPGLPEITTFDSKGHARPMAPFKLAGIPLQHFASDVTEPTLFGERPIGQ